MMKKKWEVSSAREFGLSGGDRTPDPQLRRLMLYPTELPAVEAKPKTVNLVGVERFELPTLCSQSRCATRLRYTPRAGKYSKPKKKKPARTPHPSR